MSALKELHVAGAFGIDEIVAYNRTHRASYNFPLFFPFWKTHLDLAVRRFGESLPHKQAALLVVNLRSANWEAIRGQMALFDRTILVQTEAIVGWETAYQNAQYFDYFVNFDRSYASHPGFVHANVPYIPGLASSHRDARGFAALKSQWKSSRRLFVHIYLLSFLPRWHKAAFISTLHPQEHYQIRLRAAQAWARWVDVYGGAWPSSLKNYRGHCGNKIDALRRYRFALVFENQRQPGYVTEKLLDAFVAGAVPIYWGAPDVAQLPGAEAIIPIENEHADLTPVFADEIAYQARVETLRANRHALLDLFSVERFMQSISQTLK